MAKYNNLGNSIADALVLPQSYDKPLPKTRQKIAVTPLLIYKSYYSLALIPIYNLPTLPSFPNAMMCGSHSTKDHSYP